MQGQPLLHKLTNMNSEIEKKNNIDIKITKHNTLFILDWDDTLFPTSWTTKNKINIINKNSQGYIEHFKSLDRTLCPFLKKLKEYGKVIIVTNALKDWVKISSIILPQTYYVLKSINIMSARSLISNQTSDIMEWKKRTFQMIIDEEFKNKSIMNIISIGDAEYEHNALVSLTQTNFNKIKFLKSFRLIRDPTYDQLIEQIELLNTYIDKFWYLNSQLCKTFKLY